MFFFCHQRGRSACLGWFCAEDGLQSSAPCRPAPALDLRENVKDIRGMRGGFDLQNSGRGNRRRNTVDGCEIRFAPL